MKIINYYCSNTINYNMTEKDRIFYSLVYFFVDDKNISNNLLTFLARHLFRQVFMLTENISMQTVQYTRSYIVYKRTKKTLTFQC